MYRATGEPPQYLIRTAQYINSVLAEGTAVCNEVPIGKPGIEDCQPGQSYNYRKVIDKIGKVSFRIYKNGGSYYETIGPRTFRKYFTA
jgi:hypothetical protein